MGQVLTDAEIAILASRLQAGQSGHRQRVLATARVPLDTEPESFRAPQFPWAVKMPNGQAGVIFSGLNADPLVNARRVYFLRYDTENSASVQLLFPYATYAFGIVVWNGNLLACAVNPSDESLRVRSSADNGRTWVAESVALPAGTFPFDDVWWQWGSPHAVGPSFQMATNRAGDTLFLFNAGSDQVLMERHTTARNASSGWTTAATTGLTIPSLGRNYGGAAQYNQGFQRAFSGCETRNPGTWVMACEADDGDWHANHMVTRGSLGGAWTRVLNAGAGGGLSGGQAANGGVFPDEDGDLVYYIMSDSGTSVPLYTSADEGTTWSGPTEAMPGGISYGEGIGGGAGAAIPGYTGLTYIWGGCGEFVGSPPGPTTSMGVMKLGEDGAALPNWVRLFGAGTLEDFQLFGDEVYDLSDRVIAIGIETSVELNSDGLTLALANEDAAISRFDPLAPLYYIAKPGTLFQVWQWYGDVANAEQTFEGRATDVALDENSQIATFRAQDTFYPLLNTEILPTAPQDDSPGAILDMENYVYINKTANEVLTDLLLAKGSIAESAIALADSDNFVFTLITFQAGSVGDALIRTCQMAGLRIWADREGIIRTESLNDLSKYAYWHFRSSVDITALEADISDEETYTHVKVLGADPDGNALIGTAENETFWQSWGEARTRVVRDQNVHTQEEADYVAANVLAALDHFHERNVLGILGHPGLEKMDRVTIEAQGSGLLSDWRVISLRSDQDARNGTYVAIMVVEPWQ